MGAGHDLRLAVRALRATPLLAALAVLSLALAIGANTAIFSLVDATLLRTLPVANPHRLATVSSDFALAYGYRNGIGWNYAMWRRFAANANVFDGAFAWTWSDFNIAADGEADRVHGMIASGAFFNTLGVPALAGRTFTPADDVRGGGPDGPVAVITHAFWQRHFGGAPGAIGSHLNLDGVPFTVIGVTPANFSGIEVGESLDVVVPLGTDALLKDQRTLLDHPEAMLLTVMVRVRPGQSFAAATSALRAMQPEILDIAHSSPPRFAREPFVLVPAATGSTDKSQLRQRYEQPLIALAIVVGLVLVIGCVNIANLLLARLAGRAHEISVRAALGASRWQLARPFFLESLLLAGTGAAVGLLFADWSSRWLVTQLSTPGGPMTLTLLLDGRVLGFTAAIACAASVLFGTAPTIRAARAPASEVLHEPGRASTGPRRTALSRGLIVVQVTSSMVLLAAAELFVGTFARLAWVPLGFDPARLVVASVDLSRTPLATERDRGARQLTTAVASVPGVESAAASLATPGPGGGANLMMDARGRAVTLGGSRRAMVNAVSPGWFATYGVALRAGRDITVADTTNAMPVVVVNETLARTFFPGQRVLGRQLDDDEAPNQRRTIVGIVADVVYGSRRDDPGPTAYVPLAQSTPGPVNARSVQVSFRSAGTPTPQLLQAIGRTLTSTAPGASFSFANLRDRLDVSMSQERLVAGLAGSFAALAALLTALGLYGVTAYQVSSRRMEMGVRLALGGSSRQVIALVLRQVLWLVLIGAAAGLVLCLWLSPLANSLLYGLGPRDPATLAASAALLVSVAALAAWWPARLASRITLTELLRPRG